MESLRAFLQLPDDAPTGKGIRVGVVDTGIDYTHPDLEGAVDRTTSTNCMVPTAGLILGDGDCMDYYGHGTQVAGAIAGSGAASGGRYRGIAPNASLVALKVADDHRGCEPYVRSAVYAAQAQDVQIINLSFLGVRPPTANGREIAPPWPWPLETPLSEDLRQIAAKNGILCVAAAGNSGEHGRGTMGKYTGVEEVLAVGACDCAGTHCRWSSMGPYYVRKSGANTAIQYIKPDFVAPGDVVIVPLSEHSRHVRDAGKDPAYYGGRYWPAFGTSIAAAVTSGLAACALEKLMEGPRKPGDNAGRVLRRILRLAAAEQPKSDHDRYGAGILTWPAIDRQITRFQTDYPFFSKMLSDD